MKVYRTRDGDGWSATNLTDEEDFILRDSKRWRRATRWESLWYHFVWERRFSYLDLVIIATMVAIIRAGLGLLLG